MSKRLGGRVLILAPRPPGHGFGGAERHLDDLATVLRPISRSVRFLSWADAPPPVWWERLLTRFEPMLTSPLAVRRLMRKGLPEADLVLSVELMGVGLKHPGHLHLFFGSYTCFRASALQPCQGVRKMIQPARSRLAQALEKWTQHKLGAVANSQGLRDAMQQSNLPVRNEVLPPPTDCNIFSPGDKRAARKALGLPSDKKVVLFAGRWEYAKGADRIVRLYEAMPNNWHLVVVTPSAFTFPALVGAKVTTITDLETAQMVEVYRAADVLVQPSRFEGYSLVVSEAQACGCPVLTSPVGQAAHLLAADDPLIRASVISSPDNAGSWLARLHELLASDASLRGYAAAHRRYALSHVSIPAVQKNWHDFLMKVFEEYPWALH